MTQLAALAWATHLLASWWDSTEELPAPAAPADAEAVVALLRRNGVPLLTLATDVRPSSLALLAEPAFRTALAADAASRARQEAAFTEIRGRWTAAGIPALFVKAMGPAPTFPYVSNNLDVLVPQAQQDEARAIVRRLGYVELRHIEEPNKFLFRRYHRGRSAFDLHIHGRLEWHTEFVDSRAVWQHAAYASDGALALVPAPQDGLLIALAHAIYENKALKLVELAKFAYAARVLSIDWHAAAEGAAARGWLGGFWGAVALCSRWEARLFGETSLPPEVYAHAEAQTPPFLRSRCASLLAGELCAPLPLPFVDSKRLFYGKMLADPSQTARERGREIYTHTLYGARVRLRLRSQRPLLVALDGIDGSGKGTQAALFDAALEGAALRHRIVWTRGGSSIALRPLLALGKRLLPAPATGRAAGASTTVREVERALRFSHPLARRIWPWLIAVELMLSNMIRIGWPLLRGEVVVADRYVLSALVELGARLGRRDIARTLPARLLWLVSPRPAASYWLEVPPTVAVERKAGDEATDFLAQQAEVASEVVCAFGVRRLDGCLPVDALSDAIITETLRAYEDRHRTLLNAFFCANPRPLRLNREITHADWS